MARLRLLAAFCLLVASGRADALPFELGNLLVTFDKTLSEQDRFGNVVQSFPVPHPDTTRYDALDVVVDDDGFAHVLSIAPFDNDYLSTFDPILETWEHHPVDAFFGNLSDGDLSILGDRAFTKSQAIDLGDFSTAPISLPGAGVGEIAVGLDGLLYALDTGSPRAGVRVLDATGFGVIRTLELRDTAGLRLNARGIAVRQDGTLFVIDFDGRLFEYSADGELIQESPAVISSGAIGLEMRRDGKLLATFRFGEVVLTDASFTQQTIFDATGSSHGFAYASFLPIPEPGTGVTCALGLLALAARRRVNARTDRG